MDTQIDHLDIVCSDNGIRGAPSKIEVFGTPLHSSKKELIEDYINNSRKDFFQREQLESCGNYVLYDGRNSEAVQLITSPGYSSGYVYADKSSTRVSNLLSHAVEAWGKGERSINKDYLKLFLNKQRPFQGTPFKNVSQFRPASFYRIESGEITEERSYLTAQRESPSVTEAYHECAAALSDEHVTVMFSGGLDSLSWYLVLRDELGANQVDLATVDWRPNSKSQGPYLARPVADRLGVDMDVISFDDGWMTDDKEVVNHITSWMKNDITRERNPNHALVKFDEVNDIVVNLTNNESILTLQMNHLYLRDLFNRNRTILRNIEGLGNLVVNQVLHNTQYTSKYMQNLPYRAAFFTFVWPTLKLIDTIYPAEIGSSLGDASINEIDLSRSAIIESIVAKVNPNIRAKKYHDIYESEAKQLATHIPTKHIHHVARLSYYYTHMAWASNMLEKCPLSGQDATTYLPTTWGPMLSSCLFDELTIVDALRPRRELLKIVKQETGYSFDELRRLPTDDQRISVREYKTDTYSSIFATHKSLLLPERSMMLANMDEDSQDWYEYELNSILDKMKNNRNKFEIAVKASRMINLELLLNNSIS
jgi:hypothetical protein